MAHLGHRPLSELSEMPLCNFFKFWRAEAEGRHQYKMKFVFPSRKRHCRLCKIKERAEVTSQLLWVGAESACLGQGSLQRPEHFYMAKEI